MIDRADKETRVFCIMNDRAKETLPKIIKENIYTNTWENENDEEEENDNIEENLKTRIYTDCYSSYQPNDFKEMGYILHRT